MARRLDPAQTAAAVPKAAAAPQVDADLGVLYPDREITIAGRVLVVREYGFVEGMRLRGLYGPFFDALYARIDIAGLKAPLLHEVEEVVADHIDAVTELMARAADVDAGWVRELGDEDGHALLNCWWLVFADFFIRRVIARAALSLRENRRAGPASATPSSPPATDAAPPKSDASPAARSTSTTPKPSDDSAATDASASPI